MAEWREFSAARLLRRLAEAGVDFVVVGGIAAVAHGSSRITRDLDICYATDDVNLEALGGVLVDLDARLRGVAGDVAFVPDARTLRRTRLLTLETRDGALDLLVDPTGSPAYEDLRERAEPVSVDGHRVLIASVGDLIAMKKASGRPVDLVDVEYLEAIERLR